MIVINYLKKIFYCTGITVDGFCVLFVASLATERLLLG